MDLRELLLICRVGPSGRSEAPVAAGASEEHAGGAPSAPVAAPGPTMDLESADGRAPAEDPSGSAASGLGSLIAGVVRCAGRARGGRGRGRGQSQERKYEDGRFADSWHKADHMRLQGQVTKLKKDRKIVAPHVQRRIDKLNAAAKTQQDRVDIDESKPQKIRGRGQYRRWLASAIQKVCFGNNALQQTKGIMRSAASFRVLADFFEASHAHIRQLRACMARHVLMLQHALLAGLPSMQHVIWICAFDETEMNLCAEQTLGETRVGNLKRHILMVHFLVFARLTLSHGLRRKECIS